MCHLLVPGHVRAESCDSLFGRNLSDNCNVAHSVCDALLKCPPSVRAAVVQNVIVCGGTSQLQGFAQRFVAELNHAVCTVPRYAACLRGLCGKFTLSESCQAFPAACLPWIGASLLASFSDLSELYLTRQHLAALSKSSSSSSDDDNDDDADADAVIRTWPTMSSLQREKLLRAHQREQQRQLLKQINPIHLSLDVAPMHIHWTRAGKRWKRTLVSM
jgi:hypothetical protein